MLRPKSCADRRRRRAAAPRAAASVRKDVVAHRRQRPAGAARHLLGVHRLLVEGHDLAAVVDLEDAERARLFDRDRDDGDRGVRLGSDVRVDHLAHVHLVHVVAAEDDHVVRLLVGDDVERLVDGVGRALEPGRAGALLRRHHLDVEIEERRQAPAARDVRVERVGLVLRQHLDLQQARVDQVRQHEVDEPVAPAHRHRRLGAIGGQRPQPSPFAAGQHQRQHVSSGASMRSKGSRHGREDSNA